MNYKDALELCIEATETRINQLGEMATELHEEMGYSDDREEWAALRSAQGGMMECLDLMQQFLAMAKSFDLDPAGIHLENTATIASEGLPSVPGSADRISD